jgi:putative flippase GtrA
MSAIATGVTPTVPVSACITDRLVDLTPPRPLVDLVVPVYDEELSLEPSIRRLARELRERFPFSWRITIADNASRDGTWAIAGSLAREIPGVRAVHLPTKGRGRALRAAWTMSDAFVVAYTDVDLSTGLNALLPLVAPLVSGHSDLAIGSRLVRGARVTRGPKRELVSRVYNRLLHLLVRARFSDAQCGFKAARATVVRSLLPAVENDNWFFDTEMLLLAERNGLRIHEVAVDWVDDPDSRVDIVATALEDLRGVARVLRRIASGRFAVDVPGAVFARATAAAEPSDARLARQLGRFAVVGAITTVLHLTGFAALRGTLGNQGANALALTGATLINTALNRRFTFGLGGPARAVRDQVEAGLVFVAGLGLTAGALGGLDAAWPTASGAVALGALLFANALTTLARFLALRAWVFNPARRSPRRALR